MFDIRALWRSGLGARAPECEINYNGGLNQYDAGPFEQQQFGTAGIEGLDGQYYTVFIFCIRNFSFHSTTF